RDELEDPEFEVESPPHEAEEDVCPGACGLVEQQPNTNADKTTKKTTVEDRVRTFHLRKNLNHLDKIQEEKDLFTEKTREELGACRQRMEAIRAQQASMAAAINSEKEANNVAAAGRLQAASRRLCTELENERDLQAKITAVLAQSEIAMWHFELQQRQLEDFRKTTREEAEAAEKRRQVHAAQLLRKEKAAAVKAERNQQLRVRKSLLIQQGHGLGQRKLVEDAQRNHRTAVKFLKASLGRIREREKEEEAASRKHMKRRMDAVLALKSSIAANRETLRKFQVWSQVKGHLAEQKAQEEKEAILAQGGDAFKHLFHQRRQGELEAQTRAFEEEQKLRKQEIVDRILKEEAEEENRKKRLLPPCTTTDRWTLRDKTWSYVSDFCEGKTTPPPTFDLPEDNAPKVDPSRLMRAISIESVHSESTTNLEEKNLAEPEISGLWNEDHKPCQVPEEDVNRKPVGGTKMDKDILARTMERLRSGRVQRQVASGHEFKGRPFNSKPEIIHFKDFDVGKVYKKKITLINATYTINYCKLVGVEEHLRDFIRADFDPPGPMSAGMSCEVLITFKPMINKDLEGNVSFLAQTGGFSVPLKCSTKKCRLSLDKELIDFGSHVVGETATRAITLTNVGGLGTEFRFLQALDPGDTDDSRSLLRASSLYTYEEKSFYEKGITSFSEQQFDAYESSPVDMQSRKESEEDTRAAETERLTTMMASVDEQMEITLGGVTEGHLGPFSSVKVPIIFTPSIPGEVQTRFKITFKTPQCPTLYFRATGVAIDVSVWLAKPNVDLKICMYDRLYQASVLVHTRSNAALRLKFEVCKELRGHMELLPETGYIQAHSSYSVQLKFLPRHSLPEDARKYFDQESRVLEAPMTIWVADQTKPVGFTVHAVVTTSDLELSPPELDFGCCTIHEAVRTEVSLHNHSLLPQDFGFVRLPKFVDIQPGDGFGTILPLETLQLDVIFQPTKAKEYSFELVCKSEINRCFKLSCRAVGVHPPLELSHYQIKFRATALYDTSVATVYVTNSHVSMNSLTHSVPRIGSEDPSTVGPTSFEFLLPPDSPITIAPSVGTVSPGKKCLVQVAFRPVLPEELIQQEALRMLSKEIETKPSLGKDVAAQRKDLCRPSSSTMQLQNRDRALQVSAHPSLELQEQDLKASSDRYQAAQASLARAFQGKFDKFVVPCVVASGDVKDRKGLEPLSFSPHNTLYLELWCPSVAPSIVVTSEKGKTIFDFGDVALGHSNIKKVSIQNISPVDLAVGFSVLDPNGPFILLKPSSKLRAGETQVLVLSFSPRKSILAQETLDIITKRGTLTLTLTGTGVASMTTCSIEDGVLDMGYVIARESVSSGFTLQNNSSLPIKFSMQLESLCCRGETQQQLPQFLASSAQRTQVVGTQNFNGQSVFSVAPVEGVMEPGRTQDFTVTFSPDHESLYFSDRLRVVLFKKTVSHQILLKGAAREHMMFVEGGDPLDVPVESLAVVSALDAEHREDVEELRHILVTLEYVQFDTDVTAPLATRELQVGCIRTTQLSPKKPDHPLTVSALLQLRGDIKETYKIIFVAQVVTGR
uniref:Cilia- and flagella-associated protein 74 n=1 Tax=Microcebus murinus TaxID=30608 RepID=A0A8C5UPS3_MICMU